MELNRDIGALNKMQKEFAEASKMCEAAMKSRMEVENYLNVTVENFNPNQTAHDISAVMSAASPIHSALKNGNKFANGSYLGEADEEREEEDEGAGAVRSAAAMQLTEESGMHLDEDLNGEEDEAMNDTLVSDELNVLPDGTCFAVETNSLDYEALREEVAQTRDWDDELDTGCIEVHVPVSYWNKLRIPSLLHASSSDAISLSTTTPVASAPAAHDPRTPPPLAAEPQEGSKDSLDGTTLSTLEHPREEEEEEEEAHERLPELVGTEEEQESARERELAARKSKVDSFNLRVVFEKNRTGLEPTKELTVAKGELLGGRYEVRDLVGEAAFSTVMKCVDTEKGNEYVCVKCIKNEKDYVDQSIDEIKLLRYVNSQGDPDRHHVLRLLDFFYFREHLFIVGELLKDNLYEFQRFTAETGGENYFHEANLRRVARQILEALDFVHSLGLIHCDVKPENILIKSFSKVEVKLIDFGSSCFATDTLTTYVQSRAYRAPEVILGCAYGPAIDVWSLGCVLAELLTGRVLFENASLAHLLCRMSAVRGPFPSWMVRKGVEASKYFNQHLIYEQRAEDPDVVAVLYPKPTTLSRRVPTEDAGLLAFLERTLEIDCTRRPSAKEALSDAWFREE